MRLVIGSDHVGFPLQEEVAAYIHQLGLDLVDVGTHSTAAVSYPDSADVLSKVLLDSEAGRGALIGGSGIGASVAANKPPSIRTSGSAWASPAWQPCKWPYSRPWRRS